MDNDYEKKFNKLEDAVAYAIEIKATHIVQRYFDEDEFMGEKENVSYDVDTVENCAYNFYICFDDAEEHRKFGMWSYIVGSHQTTLDVQKYLDYSAQQNPDSDRVKKLITRKNKRDLELPF